MLWTAPPLAREMWDREIVCGASDLMAVWFEMARCSVASALYPRVCEIGVAAFGQSETYNFHRLDLERQAGFIVTIYDEDGIRLAATTPFSTPAEAFTEAGKIINNRVEGPKK